MPTTVAAALALIPSTAWDGAYVEFGDPGKVIALNGGEGSGPLETYVGIGESQLSQVAAQPASVLGFDPMGAGAALTVGNAPHQVTLLYGGFDPAKIGSKLAAAGFKQHGTVGGGAIWAIGDNYQPIPQNPVGPTLDVMLVSSTRIAIGGATADVEALAAPPSTPLSADADVSAVADCLGSALAAMIGPQSGGSTRNAPLIGIGLLADSAQDASEELCVTVTGTSSAATIAAKWTAEIDTGRSRSLDEPWSSVFTDPQASTMSPVDGVTTVRLTVEPAAGHHVGTLLEDYYSETDESTSLIGAL